MTFTALSLALMTSVPLSVRAADSPAHIEARASRVSAVADNCEYYIDAFGAAYDSHGDKWLEGIIKPYELLNSRGWTVLGAGAAVTYLSQQQEELPPQIIVAQSVGDDFLVAIPYLDRGTNGECSDNRCYGRIRSFNVFLDVKDLQGQSFRLWAAAADELLNLETVFWGYPYSFRERGPGNGITYTFHPSPIMRLKKRCANG